MTTGHETEATPESRRDVAPRYDTSRDSEDERLLNARAFDELFAVYLPVVLSRARLRGLPDDEASDVTQDVFVRLLIELRSGKRYRVPFRVIVHQRTTWVLLDHMGKKTKRRMRELGGAGTAEESQDLGNNPYDDVEDRLDWQGLLASLTEGQRRVADLRWRLGMAPGDIARELEMTRNAVDQALHRALSKLRKPLSENDG